MARLKCLLITSLDTDWLSEFSINAITKEMEIIKVLRLNRESASIDRILWSSAWGVPSKVQREFDLNTYRRAGV